MKKLLFTFYLFTILFHQAIAQKKVAESITAIRAQASLKQYPKIFSVVSNNVNSNAFISGNSAIILTANEKVLQQIETEKSTYLSLDIPTKEPITLELIPINIFAPGYKVINANNETVAVNLGVHYKGIIKGDPNSLVSINIINGELSGFVSNSQGNFVLGKLQNSTQYIYYKDNELLGKPNFDCGVNDSDFKPMMEESIERSTSATSVACRAAQIYVEVDNAMYTDQGSNIGTATTFTNTLFAQVAVLYSNEGIDIQISQVKVWNTVDPYTSATTTATLLPLFDTQVGNAFNGDLAHLLSSRFVGGGMAGGGLCSKGKAVSGNLTTTVTNVPTYSWNVNVVAHEMGHNFGSPHTHSCTWPGGPIDNCAPVEDGACSPGPAPNNGGTVMSYCHLTAAGMNFSNGFGPLPGNLIRNSAQSCLGTSVTPVSLAVVESYSTSVILNWTHSVGGTFTVEYKPTSSAIWIVTTTAQSLVQLTSLTANTSYNWRVKIGCSTYATSTFTTNNTPPIVYCTPTYSVGCGGGFNIGINDVIVGGINYNPASGCSSGGYGFITGATRNLTKGQTYNFTVNPSSAGNSIQLTIWIDYNKDGTFSNGEKIFTTTSATTDPITGSFTVPGNATLVSKTRMRVVANFSSNPGDPCGSYAYGETEEFFINIISSTPCLQTVNLVAPANNITSGTTTIQAASSNGKIIASNIVSGNTTKATYQAKSIELNQGFKADTGTTFRAEVGGCSN